MQKYASTKTTKDHYFCLKARDYIEHEIDENIGCKGYKPILYDKHG